MSPNENLSGFFRSLWLTLLVFIVFDAVFAIYVHSERQIDHANESRLQSLLLADELRQSSDDLTRQARSYVVTGEARYKNHHREILDIRDGKKPRPLDYQYVYWDLVLADEARPRPDDGKAVALLDLMRQAGFTDQEFAKLAQAKAYSDALTVTENEVMRLLESSAPPADANRLRASQMLHDAAYQQAKAEIMRPIGEVQQMVDQRTLDAVRERQEAADLLRLVLIAFGVLLLLVLWRAYRALNATLGGSVDELYARIVRLGKGNLSTPIKVAPGMENSVLGWLAETQGKLARIEAGRKEAEAKNTRLTRLYKALNECNQAIVRCTDEAELFAQITRDVVVYGGMKMAWIGLLDGTGKEIRPVASFGMGTDYLDGIVITADAGEPEGRGPTGTATREDHAVWCQDFQADLSTSAWRERGAKFGWGATASLPLHRDGAVIGAFTLYATEANAFDEAAQNLLVEMAMDIDFALNSYEREAQRKQAQAALADSLNLLQTIINTAPVRIFWKDKNLRYLGCNPAFAKDAGLVDPQEMVGKDDYQLVWKEQAELFRADDLRVMESGVPKLFYDEPLTTHGGKKLWLRTSKVALRNEEQQVIGVLGIYEDITEQKHAEERIQYLANFDALTGLPNRSLLNDHLKFALNLMRRGKGSLALMFLDIDHFKDINDTLGHSVGDALLVDLAGRLRQSLREEDTVSRLGGDEFVLLLPNTDERGACHVAHKLLTAIAEPYRIDHYDLSLTASIGIAVYPNDGADLETLAKNADTAMYRAKLEGRHGYRFFTPEMQARLVRNLQLVSALRLALEHDELQVYYQPQVSLKSGEVIGAEALLRWRHPIFGHVSPAEFVPVAEESGLILPIGEWVLRQAVRQAKTWMEEGFAPLVMAVNLSVVQFRHLDLPELVSRILDEEGLSAEYLGLELTEGVAMNNPQSAIAVMNNLYARGIHMAIDDFGTGYSSLSYLKKFKVCKLKIDQSFVRDIGTDPEDRAIVGTIIHMAKRLGLETIAEGVETAEQLAFLEEQGCDEVQGYYYSRPLPTEQFEAFVRARNP